MSTAALTDRVQAVLDRVRQPEYTGENRCLPCTIVNLVLALLASGLAALVALELAVVVLLGSVLAIAVRGYLVPYTPTLTKRYFPDRVLAFFEKGETEDEEETYEALEQLQYRRENRVDPDEFLADAGVLERTDDDCQPTGSFTDRVREHVETLRSDEMGVDRFDRETLGGLFDADPEDISDEDREYPAVKVGHRIRKWPGTAALLADVAIERTLRDHTDEWGTVPLAQRQEIRAGLRVFVETCPACDGTPEVTKDRVESCCRSRKVKALRCQDCGQQLLERDPSADTWTPRAGLWADGAT
jgi:hypothetical protein